MVSLNEQPEETNDRSWTDQPPPTTTSRPSCYVYNYEWRDRLVKIQWHRLWLKLTFDPICKTISTSTEGEHHETIQRVLRDFWLLRSQEHWANDNRMWRWRQDWFDTRSRDGRRKILHHHLVRSEMTFIDGLGWLALGFIVGWILAFFNTLRR